MTQSIQILKFFGEAVKKSRTSQGLSQEKLALNTGLDLTTINEIEKVTRSPYSSHSTQNASCKIPRQLFRNCVYEKGCLTVRISSS